MVDTRQKRAACLGLAWPLRVGYPEPDAVLGAADLYSLIGVYPFVAGGGGGGGGPAGPGIPIAVLVRVGQPVAELL